MIVAESLEMMRKLYESGKDIVNDYFHLKTMQAMIKHTRHGLKCK